MLFEIKNIKFDQSENKIILEAETLEEETKNQLVKLSEKRSGLVLRIDEKPKKRTVKANNYFWEIIYLIAMKIGSSREEVYEQILRTYGKAETLFLNEKEMNKLIASDKYRCIEETGRKNEEGLKEVLAYPGISKYSSKEFAYLTDRLIEEAIETGV